MGFPHCPRGSDPNCFRRFKASGSHIHSSCDHHRSLVHNNFQRCHGYRQGSHRGQDDGNDGAGTNGPASFQRHHSFTVPNNHDELRGSCGHGDEYEQYEARINNVPNELNDGDGPGCDSATDDDDNTPNDGTDRNNNPCNNGQSRHNLTDTVNGNDDGNQCGCFHDDDGDPKF